MTGIAEPFLFVTSCPSGPVSPGIDSVGDFIDWVIFTVASQGTKLNIEAKLHDEWERITELQDTYSTDQGDKG